jgi:site-specific DNA-methyltransferase (adenine-specific)
MKIEDMINKVHCADCLEFMKQIPDNSIDLVLTDPPYWMSYVSSRRNIKHEAIEDDNNLDRVPEFMQEIFRIQKQDTHCYIFCNDYWFWKFREYAEKVWYTIKRTLIWIKNNHTSWDLEWDYANITEFCLFLHKWRRLLKWKRQNNLLKFDRESCDDHPTVKNKEMMKYIIEKSSDKWDIILDCFLWSWTTAVACKELWRDFIWIEKEQKYVDIANKRLDFTTTSLF